MNMELSHLERRVAVHAALADPTRLRIVDALSLGDSSASELGAGLGVASNLLAHHVRVLVEAGLLERRPSEGDHRRAYLRLRAESLTGLAPSPPRAPRRVLFVCTANTARSHLGAALWRRACRVPAASAGTRPGERINPGALAVARRHRLTLPEVAPAHVDAVRKERDLLITVCDRAHEELGGLDHLHWSVPDPAPAGTPEAFERAFAELEQRVATLAARLTASAAEPATAPDPQE